MALKNDLSLKLKKILKNKIVLVTGGGGSIGSFLTKQLLNYPVKSIRVLDIDEHALFKLKRSTKDKRLRFLLGNILDKERLEMAGADVDIIIHTAAIKNIEISEFNPIETIDANINGTVNLIKLALKLNPERFLNISTDKAVDASTLYGSTKQLGEKLTSWAGKHSATTKFATARLGNVFETRGNVIEVWNDELKNNKDLSITNPLMKRFYFHVDDAVNFIFESLVQMNKGEIFVPKMKAYKIKDLASKISKNHKIIGLRPGEKMEEVLLTKNELKNAKNVKNMWIINS
jgi:UDP-N-acetylglucosamine 4,6-dehydratase/5-epimerase